MAYSIDRAALVTKQLERLATLSAHQLAGQLENLDFWLDESLAALEVLDDYPRRFERLRGGQQRFIDAHKLRTSGFCSPCGGACEFGPQTPRGASRVPAEQLQDARRALREAGYSLFLRLYKSRWIDEARLRAECTRLGASIDRADLETVPLAYYEEHEDAPSAAVDRE
jgi:hypothetical protein